MKTKTEFEIPKVFWKFYDEYRRNVISLSEFSRCTGLSIGKIKVYLEAL
ncbi:hypothetical protein [Ethanoligenens harbinense]|uniref:Uncharacterized protein n=1 Tax=Ethanoligenens harbinense (strain DSM 18485 / JCM 12961 / CGMCC 1.5033 / YUAN-3) TaxID=663278 RepID=E6U948_ETHHY|nr:hypothetical protein [Ethanoligenens harbinense]ADU27207.1 hypothetical protein Ethha_1675 [Ethanoligenens harbinense YUAN-3]